MRVELNIDAKAFREALRRSPGLMAKSLRDGLTQLHGGFFGAMKKEHRGTGYGKRGLVLRPQIVNTMANEVHGDRIENMRGISFTTHIAARIQEHGGTIVANGRYSVCGKGKMLAIPLAQALTRGGKGTRSGRAAPGTGSAGFARTGPCDQPDLFPIRSKKGNLLLVKRTPKGIEPWFLLKKSVTIKPGLRFFETFRRVIREHGGRVLGAALGKGMRAAFGRGPA